jgi:hypothetical protein
LGKVRSREGCDFALFSENLGHSMAATTPGTVSNSGSNIWWKNGYVWMILGGPLVVIVASCITFVIAARGADPVLAVPAKVAEAAKKGVTPAEDAMVPALQGRNQASAGVTSSSK